MASVGSWLRDNWRQFDDYAQQVPGYGAVSTPISNSLLNDPTNILLGAFSADVLPDSGRRRRGSAFDFVDTALDPFGINILRDKEFNRPNRGDGSAWAMDALGKGALDSDELSDLIMANRKKAERERQKQAENRAAKKRRDYIAGWVKDAALPYDGDDGLLAQIKRDADESVSEVHRVNAGLLAPLEESKGEADRNRDEIKRMEAANRRQRDRVADAETDAAAGALGAGFIGSGNVEMDRAADIARTSSAGQQAGVNREADLSARDAKAWASEMQDWAQADAAEASKDIRKSEQRLLSQARRERAQALREARREAISSYDSGVSDAADREWERELAAARLAQSAQESQISNFLKWLGLGGETVDLTTGYDDEGKPINTTQAAYPPELLELIGTAMGVPNASAFTRQPNVVGQDDDKAKWLGMLESIRKGRY